MCLGICAENIQVCGQSRIEGIGVPQEVFPPGTDQHGSLVANFIPVTAQRDSLMANFIRGTAQRGSLMANFIPGTAQRGSCGSLMANSTWHSPTWEWR